MAIKDWAIEDRPREKLLRCSASSLSDAELLAIFLRTGIKGKSAVDLARDVLDDAGSLHALLSSSEATFCLHKGLGQAKFVQLKAVVEMSRRYLDEKMKRGNVLHDISAVEDYLTLKLRHSPYEIFACIFLDNKHRVIEFEELFRGTIDSASVHPREVIRRVIFHNAAAVIFSHNHPSGVAEPSQADKQITQLLKQALALIDVRVLDHFIIGDEIVSFAQRGLL
ncbi:MAG: DNA repair protein RadC [Cocleimonas sp.]|nr:DNA repair protein RadC [Cocleimonas sp.]